MVGEIPNEVAWSHRPISGLQFTAVVLLPVFEGSKSWLYMSLKASRRTMESSRIVRDVGGYLADAQFLETRPMLRASIVWNLLRCEAKVDPACGRVSGSNGVVRLVNAPIVYIARHVPRSVTHGESRDNFEEDEISFTFQKIEFTRTSGGANFSTDWIASN